jgi:alpha-tubulin suppressor-like RCC1 family protein
MIDMSRITFALLWFATSALAQAEDVDLSLFQNGADGVQFVGGMEHENIGASASGVGDVNGDGIDDLLIGAVGITDENSHKTGGAYLVYGTEAPLLGVLNTAHLTSWATTAIKIHGGETGALCGQAVAGIGYFNDDEFSDFAIGCPGASSATGITFVLFGSGAITTNFTLQGDSMVDFQGFRVTGATPGESSGSVLAGGGDINGDSLDDLLIGAPLYQNTGAVYAVFGRSSGFNDIDMDQHTSTQAVAITISGTYTHAMLGSALAIANVHGNRHADVVIGARGTNIDNVGGAGRVYVVSGTNFLNGDISLDAFESNDHTRLLLSYTISGIHDQEILGSGISDLGDLNGDGASELLIAASGTAYVVYSGANYVDLTSGDLRDQGGYGFRITGPGTTDQPALMQKVANVGDQNGDQVNDFALQILTRSNSANDYLVYVVYGRADGTDVDLRSLTDAQGYRIRSSAPLQMQTVAGAGDFNRDGRVDMLVGAASATVGGHNGAGTVYLLTNGAPAGTAAPSSTPRAVPSYKLFDAPYAMPFTVPSAIPSATPSEPSAVPSAIPSVTPSAIPSAFGSVTDPSEQPTSYPTMTPTDSAGKLASKTYKARNLYAFAALHPEDSTPLAWGAAKLGGNTSSVDTSVPLARIVPSTSSFLGVTSTGGLLGWGMNSSIAGWTALAGATDIVASSVVANGGAYAGLTASGAVFAVGSAAVGGNVKSAQWSNGFSSQLSYGIASITASASSFAALTSWGSVYVWGSKFTGGGVSSSTNTALSSCGKMVATTASFACLKYDGSVVTFGDTYTGGDSSAVTSQLHDVVHIVGAKSTFAAFRADGSLVTWGHPTRGGDSSAVASLLTDVVHVIYNDQAVAAVHAHGGVVTWGEARGGGDSSAVQSQLSYVRSLYATGKAFAALTASGGVVAWGDESNGGEVPSSLVSQLYYGVKEVYATRRAFAALKHDGPVHVWGNAYQGGEAYAATDYLSAQVNALCANEAAFTAFRSDGTVVAWGHMTVLGFTGGMVIAQNAAYANISQCA